jgi:hypothetical protein
MKSPFEEPEVRYHFRRGNYTGCLIYAAVYGAVRFLETCGRIEDKLTNRHST